jgi:hypothetical protein
MQGDLDKLYENEQIIEGSSFDGNINNRRDVEANFIRWQRLWRQRELKEVPVVRTSAIPSLGH